MTIATITTTATTITMIRVLLLMAPEYPPALPRKRPAEEEPEITASKSVASGTSARNETTCSPCSSSRSCRPGRRKAPCQRRRSRRGAGWRSAVHDHATIRALRSNLLTALRLDHSGTGVSIDIPSRLAQSQLASWSVHRTDRPRTSRTARHSCPAAGQCRA